MIEAINLRYPEDLDYNCDRYFSPFEDRCLVCNLQQTKRNINFNIN